MSFYGVKKYCDVLSHSSVVNHSSVVSHQDLMSHESFLDRSAHDTPERYFFIVVAYPLLDIVASR